MAGPSDLPPHQAPHRDELHSESLAFSSEVKSLQRRLAEVRARRQAALVPPLPQCGAARLEEPRGDASASDAPAAAQSSSAAVSVPDHEGRLLGALDAGHHWLAAGSLPAEGDGPWQEADPYDAGAGLLPGQQSLGWHSGGGAPGHCDSPVPPPWWCGDEGPRDARVYGDMGPSASSLDKPPLRESPVNFASPSAAMHLGGSGSGGASGFSAGSSRRVLSQDKPHGLDLEDGENIEQLKSENNFLTEQLVEASLESAANFESFSQDRDALWRFAQDLRRRWLQEQVERAKSDAMLSAAKDALGKLAAENLSLAASQRLEPALRQVRAGTTAAPPAPPALASHHASVEQLEQECDRLRQFARQQTEQVNATIMELARRNLELESNLREAHRVLAQHGLEDQLSPSRGPGEPHLHEVSAEGGSDASRSGQRPGLANLPVSKRVSGSGSGPSRLRRSASGPAKLGVDVHGVPSPTAVFFPGPVAGGRVVGSPSSPRARSPSPNIGVDGRYTGRGWSPAQYTSGPGPTAARGRGRGTGSAKLRRSLDLATSDMRRVQRESILAAS